MTDANAEQEGITIDAGSLFDIAHRNFLYAVDLVNGGDPHADSMSKHELVAGDARLHELAVPQVYRDKMERGMSNRELNERHDLLGSAPKLLEMLDRAAAAEDRKGVIRREIEQAQLFLRVALSSDVPGVSKPTVDELWQGVTGEAFPSLSVFEREIGELRAHIMDLLGAAGVHVTNERTLKGNMDSWEARQGLRGVQDQERIREVIEGEVRSFLVRFKGMAASIPALVPFAGQLNTDSYDLRVLPAMDCDAALSYVGGADGNGRPTGKATFEWNAGRPATEMDIRYVTSHETTHMLNLMLTDLQRRSGRLGPESALFTLSTSRIINEEGLAQTILEMLHGKSVDDVAEALGPDMGVVMLLDQLQDIARIVASVGWNREFAHIEDPEARRNRILEWVTEKLLQSPAIGNKYAGEHNRWWREMPLGIAYSGAYYYGSRAYREAIAKDPKKAFAVGTYGEGLVDLQAFREKTAVE